MEQEPISAAASSVLHMTGGTGHGSYHNYSKVLESTANEFFWPKLSLAIAVCTEKLGLRAEQDAACFAIADFGCACGWSTINSMRFIAKCLGDLHASVSLTQAFFIDLPSNDFNTLFSLLSSCDPDPSTAGPVFIPCGVPGSFYSRLFPPRHLHIGLCTLALHNLSVVPEAVQDCYSPAWNEGRISTLDGCKPETLQEYKKQFKKDFSQFLGHRAEELVPGGLLFLVMIAIPSHTLPYYTKLYANLQVAWRQLIFEGLLQKESLDKFNLPIFIPTMDDVKEVVACFKAEFEVIEQEFVEIERAPAHVWKESAARDAETWGSTCVTMARNFVGSLIQAHLGVAKFELLLERFRELAVADDVVYRSSLIGIIVMPLLRSSEKGSIQVQMVK